MSETMTKKATRKIVKKVDGVCVIYSDGSIRLDKVRLSYPWVGKAQKNVNEKTGEETASYSVSAMLPKTTHRAAFDACVEAIKGLEKQMTAKGKGKGGRRSSTRLPRSSSRTATRKTRTARACIPTTRSIWDTGSSTRVRPTSRKSAVSSVTLRLASLCG